MTVPPQAYRIAQTPRLTSTRSSCCSPAERVWRRADLQAQGGGGAGAVRNPLRHRQARLVTNVCMRADLKGRAEEAHEW